MLLDQKKKKKKSEVIGKLNQDTVRKNCPQARIVDKTDMVPALGSFDLWGKQNTDQYTSIISL